MIFIVVELLELDGILLFVGLEVSLFFELKVI